MILELESSIATADLNDVGAVAAIENLLGAAFAGYHIVTGPIDVLRNLLVQNTHLSARSVAALKVIMNNRTQRDGFYRTISTRVVVSASAVDITKTSKNTWKAPLSLFADPALANKTLLLSEDRTDSELYIYAGKHYLLHNKLRNFNISARPEGGGGSRVNDRFGQVALTKSDICLCITDSDKYSPDGAIKPTAADCRSIDSNGAWITLHVHTSSRELENSLPICFIENVIDKHQVENFDALRNIACSNGSVYGYLDIKSGTKLAWVRKLPAGTKEQLYWNCFLKGNSVGSCGLTDCSGGCECGDISKCTCYIAPGLGEKIAERVLSWLKEVTPHKSFECVRKDVDTEWLAIGHAVIEWCCAEDPIRC